MWDGWMSNVCYSPLGRLVDRPIQHTPRWTRPLVTSGEADFPQQLVRANHTRTWCYNMSPFKQICKHGFQWKECTAFAKASPAIICITTLNPGVPLSTTYYIPITSLSVAWLHTVPLDSGGLPIWRSYIWNIDVNGTLVRLMSHEPSMHGREPNNVLLVGNLLFRMVEVER